MLRIIGLLIFVVTLLASLTFLSVGSKESQPEVEFYLISNDIHIGFILPARNSVMDWESFINPSDFVLRATDWLEFGWGDRQFYFDMPTWEQFTWGLALDALLLPDPAVMHVGYMTSHPENYLSVRKLRVSKEQYRKIVAGIKRSFVLKHGRPILISNKGYEGSDNFYEAEGSYSLVRTCNVWTADILGEAGLKRPIWSPTKYGLEKIW